MKSKIVFFIMTFICILYSCKSSKQGVAVQKKELNYIPYYLKVYEAKNYYEAKKYRKSFDLLDSLFQHFEPIETPTIYEMDIYCELSVMLRKYNKKTLRKVLITSVVKFGRKPYLVEEVDSFWKEAVLKSGLKRKECDGLYRRYLSGINYTLKDTIVEMYKRDQMHRRKGSNYNSSKFDSIDKVNSKILLHVLKKYGYPRENIIGGMEIENPVKPNYLSTVLMHLNYNFYKINLQDLLHSELQKGKLYPLDYAMMLDKFYLTNRNTDMMINYDYLGTFNNTPIDDSVKTNNARNKIGLPKITKNINN